MFGPVTRLVTLLAAASVASAAAASPAFAAVAHPQPRSATILASQYQYECAVAQDNMHAYIDQGSISYVYVAFADVTYLRPAYPCTVGDGSSLVLPVNIQGIGFCAAQLGWGSINSGNQQYFLYTSQDNCVLSPLPGAPTPVTGHSYHFSILALDCCHWQYSVRDNTTAHTYTVNGSRTGNGNEVWAGFEVHYADDVMGGEGSAQYITAVAWKTSSGGSNIYLTNTTLHKGACTPSTNCIWQSYWHAGTALDASNHAEIWAYTTAH